LQPALPLSVKYSLQSALYDVWRAKQLCQTYFDINSCQCVTSD
jgi:hypothetical protein